MKVVIHPDACSAFNRRATALLPRISEIPRTASQDESFPSHIPVAATLTDKDITGEIRESATDYQGNTVGKFYQQNGTRYGLVGQDYLELRRLAASVSAAGGAHGQLSSAYIEEQLFQWIRLRLTSDMAPVEFCEALVEAAERDVQRAEVWVPISNLEIESAFNVGSWKVRPITRAEMDAWQKGSEGDEDERRARAQQVFPELRQRFQGRAAVVAVIEAEPRRRFELAIEEAELVTQILGLFSNGTLLPDVRCVSRISGSECVAAGTVISNPGSTSAFTIELRILELSSAKPWRLNNGEIAQIQRQGLNSISALMARGPANEFERAVLSSLLIYAKAAFTADSLEKIVYMLSALESLLLKNENESIQQNLGERIAVFTSTELAQRKKTIAVIKRAYGLRSRYLHHGKLQSELEAVVEFMLVTWLFYVSVLEQVTAYSTRSEFIAAIDDAKLA